MKNIHDHPFWKYLIHIQTVLKMHVIDMEVTLMHDSSDTKYQKKIV